MKFLSPLALSALTYVVALLLPALHGSNGSLPGWLLLLFGMSQMPVECNAWLANPVYFAACLFFLLKHFKASMYLALLACLIGLDTFRATRYPINEAGHMTAIEWVGSAFYLWQLSFIIIVIGSAVRLRQAKPDRAR